MVSISCFFTIYIDEWGGYGLFLLRASLSLLWFTRFVKGKKAGWPLPTSTTRKEKYCTLHYYVIRNLPDYACGTNVFLHLLVIGITRNIIEINTDNEQLVLDNVTDMDTCVDLKPLEILEKLGLSLIKATVSISILDIAMRRRSVSSRLVYNKGYKITEATKELGVSKFSTQH
ncbi:hypothetical protein BD560DRAFT_421475 [Blakeslea trispora]|nr:hypothetical protein BD560DRAFT_421475 [Blakeslea trispora]